MLKRNWVIVTLGLIVLLAGCIRFWWVSSLPFPPNGDETAYGYYGWSLLHFGTDEYQNRYPLSFVSVGDYKYPGLAYLNIVPAALFGLISFEVRFTSALFGVGLVILMYALGYYIFRRSSAALIAAFLTTVMPWHVLGSRMGYEAYPGLTLLVSGIVLFLYARGSRLRLILSFFTLLYSTFTFAGERFFVPVFLITGLILAGLKIKPFDSSKKFLLISFILISAINGLFLAFPENRGRAGEVMWTGPTEEDQKNLERAHLGAGVADVRIPARLTWLFHNKYKLAVVNFAQRYVDHFSPKFLFWEGEATEERISGMGMLLITDLLLLPLGFFTLQRLAYRKNWLVIIFWLILAPIPSALTTGGAHITRGSLMIVPLILISTAGVISVPKYLKIGLFALIFYFVGFALNQMFIQTPTDYPWYPKQVYAEVVQTIDQLDDSYKAVVTDTDNYIYYLFYLGITPQDFVNNADITPLTATNKWSRVSRLGKVIFNMPYKCPKSGKAGVVYVCSGTEVPRNANILKVIFYQDRVSAYSFITYFPISQMPNKLPDLPSRMTYMVDAESKSEYPDGIIPDSHPSMW